MFIVGISPIAEAMLFHMIRKIKIKKDSGYWGNPDPNEMVSTKAKTMPQFMAIYSGPEMMMHFRYCNIMVTCFVSMMYGIGVPVLFPVALLNLLMAYTLDRILVVYIY